MQVNNNCTFIGRNTREIELKFIPSSGTSVATCNIAVEDTFKKDKVMFLKYKCFGKGAETLANYSDKGKLIALSGRLDIEQWQDKNGNDKNQAVLLVESFKILEWRDDNKNQQQSNNQQSFKPQREEYKSQDDFQGFQAIDLDSDVPF